jgi:hypothetical protein
MTMRLRNLTARMKGSEGCSIRGRCLCCGIDQLDDTNLSLRQSLKTLHDAVFLIHVRSLSSFSFTSRFLQDMVLGHQKNYSGLNHSGLRYFSIPSSCVSFNSLLIPSDMAEARDIKFSDKIDIANLLNFPQKVQKRPLLISFEFWAYFINVSFCCALHEYSFASTHH